MKLSVRLLISTMICMPYLRHTTSWFTCGPYTYNRGVRYCDPRLGCAGGVCLCDTIPANTRCDGSGGVAACISCPAAQYKAVVCSWGQEYDDTVCTTCENGQYCPGDQNKYPCTICPNGQYSIKLCDTGSSSNVIECRSCEPGFYCAKNMRTACPVASTSLANASGYTDCYCNPGSYGTVVSPKLAECTQCAVGSFCPGTLVKTLCGC